MRYILIISGLVLLFCLGFECGKVSNVPITKVDSIVVYKTKYIDSIRVEYKILKNVAKDKKVKVDKVLDTINNDTLVKVVNELDSVRTLQIATLEGVVERQSEVIKLKDSIYVKFCTPSVKKKRKGLKIAAIILLGLLIIK